MARRLIWTDRALSEIEEIATHIAETAPVNARNVTRRIFARGESLPDQPGQGRRVPEYEGDKELREVFVHRWRVIYLVTDAAVEIVSVIHGARLLENADPLDV